MTGLLKSFRDCKYLRQHRQVENISDAVLLVCRYSWAGRWHDQREYSTLKIWRSIKLRIGFGVSSMLYFFWELYTNQNEVFFRKAVWMKQRNLYPSYASQALRNYRKPRGTWNIHREVFVLFRRSLLLQWIPDIINVRGTLLVFLIIELSYIRVLKGMKVPVGAKIRIDYKRVFLIRDTGQPKYNLPKIDSGRICRIIFGKLFTFGKLGFGKLSRIRFLLLRSA